MQDLKKILKSPAHVVFVHSRKFLLYIGVILTLLSLLKLFRHNTFYLFTMVVVGYTCLFSFFRTWLCCNCGHMVDLVDKRRNLKSLFLFLIPTNLILLLATVAFQLSGNPLYLAFAGAWFIIVSVTGFSQKMFKPIQAADLKQKSLGHLDSLVTMQVLTNDLDAADEVSKILLERAEKLNDRE